MLPVIFIFSFWYECFQLTPIKYCNQSSTYMCYNLPTVFQSYIRLPACQWSCRRCCLNEAFVMLPVETRGFFETVYDCVKFADLWKQFKSFWPIQIHIFFQLNFKDHRTFPLEHFKNLHTTDTTFAAQSKIGQCFFLLIILCIPVVICLFWV